MTSGAKNVEIREGVEFEAQKKALIIHQEKKEM